MISDIRPDLFPEPYDPKSLAPGLRASARADTCPFLRTTLRVNILALAALTWPPCLRTAVAQAARRKAVRRDLDG
jgi:hypothetical protein